MNGGNQGHKMCVILLNDLNIRAHIYLRHIDMEVFMEFEDWLMESYGLTHNQFFCCSESVQQSLTEEYLEYIQEVELCI